MYLGDLFGYLRALILAAPDLALYKPGWLSLQQMASSCFPAASLHLGHLELCKEEEEVIYSGITLVCRHTSPLPWCRLESSSVIILLDIPSAWRTADAESGRIISNALDLSKERFPVVCDLLSLWTLVTLFLLLHPLYPPLHRWELSIQRCALKEHPAS